MRTLRTVFAIFGAAPGFDAQQRAALDVVVPAMGLVHSGRPQDQFGKGKVVDRLEFVERFHSVPALKYRIARMLL